MSYLHVSLQCQFAYLREQGLSSVIYVDDTFLGGDEFEECRANVTKTLQCLKNLGFFIHSHESIFIPTQNIIFIGFQINTQRMSIVLTDRKKQRIKSMAKDMISKKSTKREVASLLGNILASFEAVQYGRSSTLSTHRV